MAQRRDARGGIVPVKPKLSQEEFDEAVQTNIEDFDMEVSPPMHACPLSAGLAAAGVLRSP